MSIITTTSPTRLLLGATAGIACLALTAPPVHAAVGQEAIVANPAVVEPGATVTIDGSGWQCNVDVFVQVGGDADPDFEFETTDAPEDGTFTLDFAAPMTPGVYTVFAEYETECTGDAQTTFQVAAAEVTTTTSAQPTTSVAAAPATPTAALPSTGATSGIALFATLCTLLGAAIIGLRSLARPRA